MSGRLSGHAVAAAFEDACRAELDALKPGNVHRHADGHRLHVEQFETSAAVAAPFIAAAELRVGARIRKAAQATARAVGTNTNLGIILLCAPLAAAGQRAAGGGLQARLETVLADLSVEDAAEAYAGIRTANAGGLGNVAEQDVANPPSVTLKAAMQAAEERDRIAWNYTHGFHDVFATGLAALSRAQARGLSEPWAATLIYMGFLGSIPDTLIARKRGNQAAEALRDAAAGLAAALADANDPETMMPELLALDAELKARALNPGTSADLTVATLFADRLIRLAASE